MSSKFTTTVQQYNDTQDLYIETSVEEGQCLEGYEFP